MSLLHVNKSLWMWQKHPTYFSEKKIWHLLSGLLWFQFGYSSLKAVLVCRVLLQEMGHISCISNLLRHSLLGIPSLLSLVRLFLQRNQSKQNEVYIRSCLMLCTKRYLRQKSIHHYFQLPFTQKFSDKSAQLLLWVPIWYWAYLVICFFIYQRYASCVY